MITMLRRCHYYYVRLAIAVTLLYCSRYGHCAERYAATPPLLLAATRHYVDASSPLRHTLRYMATPLRGIVTPLSILRRFDVIAALFSCHYATLSIRDDAITLRQHAAAIAYAITFTLLFAITMRYAACRDIAVTPAVMIRRIIVLCRLIRLRRDAAYYADSYC